MVEVMMMKESRSSQLGSDLNDFIMQLDSMIK